MTPRAGIWLVLALMAGTGLSYVCFAVWLIAPNYTPFATLLAAVVMLLMVLMVCVVGMAE